MSNRMSDVWVRARVQFLERSTEISAIPYFSVLSAFCMNKFTMQPKGSPTSSMTVAATSNQGERLGVSLSYSGTRKAIVDNHADEWRGEAMSKNVQTRA